MKKGLTFFATLAALALGLVGCKPGGGDGKTYNVSITNKAALAEIYDDDNSKSVSVQIEGVITGDAYAAHDLVVTSSDESVMTINGNNRLRPVAAGNVTVKATYKHKFSDSVDIRVIARPALRIATSLSESGEYLLATPLTSGRVYSSAHMATGAAKFYISGSTDMDDAAQAKVVLNSSATDDYKWEIHLQDPDSEDVKVLGTAANENNGWHYNLGFVGDVVPDTEIAYQKAYFKLTAAPQFGLETVVTYDTDKTATLLVGTQTGKTTMSLGDTTKVVPAHLYEMGEPIPATAVTVSPKTPAAGRPGEKIQLTATLTPETSSDVVTWSSDNRDVADVDETGLVTLKANGTAHITAQARPNVTDTATVVCEGEALNFGTKEHPLTVEQARDLLDVFGDNTLTSEKMFVRGVVSVSPALSQGRRNLWLKSSDGTVNKSFELYSCQNTEFPALPTEADALIGYTVTATGWGYKYVGSSTTYEFTNKDASGNYDNPEIVAYTEPAPAQLEGVSVTPATASVDVLDGQKTKQFTASPVPSNATLGSVTWTVVDEPAGVSVSDSGLVTVAQSAVEEDATKTVTIKATAGGFNGTASLTITRSTSGGGADEVIIPTVGNSDLKTAYDAAAALSSGVTSEMTISGVVVATCGNSYFVQNNYCGMYVYNNAVTGMAVGKNVTVTATYQNYSTLVETKTVSSSVLGSDGTLPDSIKVLTLAQLGQLKQSIRANAVLEFVSKDKVWSGSQKSIVTAKLVKDGVTTSEQIKISFDKYGFSSAAGTILNALAAGEKFTITDVVTTAYNASAGGVSNQLMFCGSSEIVKN